MTSSLRDSDTSVRPSCRAVEAKAVSWDTGPCKEQPTVPIYGATGQVPPPYINPLEP